MRFSGQDAAFIGTLLSHLFFGAHITVFGLYVQITRARRPRLSLADYGVIAMFVLTLAFVVLDTVQQFYTLRRGPDLPAWIGKVNATTSTLNMTLDFLSQVILIHRCWFVFGRALWVAILPGILALASWVCGLAVTIDLSAVVDIHNSKAVNALVSILMISRIWIVYSQAKSVGEHTGRRLSWLIAVLIESAIVLFAVQLIVVLMYGLPHRAFALVISPITVIYVRPDFDEHPSSSC
ncbi:hypothetical protein NMY22_g2373 [Coprinellus aureogranulatus]|nr:hypothetical protein NMY22_g2373 [Coprinellus aureogranulatus]